jgi:hypothetical protein
LDFFGVVVEFFGSCPLDLVYVAEDSVRVHVAVFVVVAFLELSDPYLYGVWVGEVGVFVEIAYHPFLVSD